MILFLKALAKYTELERRKKSSYLDVGIRTKRITIIKAAEYYPLALGEANEINVGACELKMDGGNKAKNPSK